MSVAPDPNEPLRSLTADMLDLIVEARKNIVRGSKLDVLMLRMRDRVLQDANRVDPPVAKPMPLIMSGGPGHQADYIATPGDLHGPHQPPPAGNTLPS